MYVPGARCAMSIQPVLHELGCLPVSKMVHLPAPQARKYRHSRHWHITYRIISMVHLPAPQAIVSIGMLSIVIVRTAFP